VSLEARTHDAAPSRARGSKRSARPTWTELRRHGDGACESTLAHGDNLDVLRAMRGEYEGRFSCIYIDPPFNTGRRFEQYDDARPSEAWVEMMRPRLEAMAPLLAEDGALFAEIDDTQLAHLQILCDRVFGAHNRVSTVTVVRSAATGHKAINAGPVHVTDFILIYARDRKKWRYRAQKRPREGMDRAYGTWLVDPDAPREAWTFRPLRSAAAEHHGYASSREATRDLGGPEWTRRVEAFALAHARHVVRFAQPRYDAIARAAQRLVDASRGAPDRVMWMARPGRPDFILKGGNRILFLADKVAEVDGRPSVVEPLTNVWDDIPFQGIAREGGVVFSRNKKPERLLERVIAMSTSPRDWVLDPFAGSGTTLAVASKMGRRWFGIESGAHALTMCEPRLERVLAGRDVSGVRPDAAPRGGFRVVRA
jgi:adenine-specific DNA-methyltransferase